MPARSPTRAPASRPDHRPEPAQNLVPAANTEFIEGNQEVADLLNEISATLTTEDLAAMTVQIDVQRQRPEDVATAYLEVEGLL